MKDTDTAPKDRRAAKSRGEIVALLFIFLLCFILVAATAIAGYLVQGLIIIALLALYPLSYIAYQTFRIPVRVANLAEDFRLLGLAGSPIDEDAAKVAEREVAERYGASYDPLEYALNIALAALVTFVGAVLFFWPPSSALLGKTTHQALSYGFLGAYLFSAHLIYRRYTTYDLQPTVYLNGALTVIAGLIFNFVAFEAITNLVDTNLEAQAAAGIGAGAVAIIAFSLGYFPYLALRWFNRVAYGALGVVQRRADALDLGLIDGVSQWHEVRLRDNGIDNVQNLAAADIADLLIHTAFSGQQVVDWVDQGILYLYLDQGAVSRFRDIGLRTTSDFHALWEADTTTDDQRANLAAQLQTNVAHLSLLYTVTKTGPNVHYVANYWENARLVARHRQDAYVLYVRYYATLEKAGRVPLSEAVASADLQRLRAQETDLRHEIAARTGREPEKPQTPLALVGMGKLAYATGDLDAAEAYFTQAVERAAPEQATDAAQAHAALGTIYLQRGDLDRAGAHFEEAARLAPDSPDVLNDRAIYYRYAGRLDDAQNDLEKVVARHPDFALAHVNLGDVYRDKGQYDLAVASYRRAIDIDPDLAIAYNNLAWLYADKLDANHREALDFAERAVALSERQTGRRDPNYLDTLAAVQAKLGLVEDARRSLREALASPAIRPAVRAQIERRLQQIEPPSSDGDEPAR